MKQPVVMTISGYYDKKYNVKFIYRYDPVPNIGLNHWKFYKWYRRFKTTSEKRQYYYLLGEENNYNIKIRVKRRPSYLKNSWDDIPKTIQNNWKKFRNNQYKNN